MSDLLRSMSDQWAALGCMSLSMALGGIVGFDRELSGKSAGLRTHMIVAGASSYMVSLGIAMIDQTHAGDLIRIVQAIVTGISFLGAGTIIVNTAGRSRHVQGLTTAASILFVSAIGMSVAMGKFALGIGGTVLVLFALRALRRIDLWLDTKSPRIDEDWDND